MTRLISGIKLLNIWYRDVCHTWRKYTSKQEIKYVVCVVYICYVFPRRWTLTLDIELLHPPSLFPQSLSIMFSNVLRWQNKTSNRHLCNSFWIFCSDIPHFSMPNVMIIACLMSSLQVSRCSWCNHNWIIMALKVYIVNMESFTV